MRGSYVYYAVEIEREEREEGSSSLSKLDLEGEEEEERGLWHTICVSVGENMSGKEIFLHLRFPPPPPSP